MSLGHGTSSWRSTRHRPPLDETGMIVAAVHARKALHGYMRFLGVGVSGFMFFCYNTQAATKQDTNKMISLGEVQK